MKTKNSKNIPALTIDEQGKLLGGYTSPAPSKPGYTVNIKNRNCHGSALASGTYYENYNCYSTCSCK
jgi:hypothetical protein